MLLEPLDLQNAWNANRQDMLVCSTLDIKDRRRRVMARLRDVPDLRRWVLAIQRAAKSRFCTGGVLPKDGGTPFVANFDWLLRPEVLVQIEEGQYDDRELVPPDSPSPQKDATYWELPKPAFELPNPRILSRAATRIMEWERRMQRMMPGPMQQMIISEELAAWKANGDGPSKEVFHVEHHEEMTVPDIFLEEKE